MGETSWALTPTVQAVDPDLRQRQRAGGKVPFDERLVRSWRVDMENVTEIEVKDDSLVVYLA